MATKKTEKLLVIDESPAKPRLLSKAEKKKQRKEENRQWMVKNRGGWSEDDPNPRHSLYYQAQIADLAGEWDLFLASMRKDLPSTFRISEMCDDFLSALLQVAVEEEYRRPRGRYIATQNKTSDGSIIQPVPWCPHSYELAVDNSGLAKEKGLEKLQRFLQREVLLGHIVRQELVSMIPALLLDVQHSHFVLDLCAAPGSKTEQLLGMMAQSARLAGLKTCSQGVLVANDIDAKRITTLQQRLLHSSAPHFVLTNSDAAQWSANLTSPQKEVFDRILCDVPCSGDGTLRKCPHLWRLFRPRIGLEFHAVQLKIMMEAVRLLRPGGMLVYSTCSLNPLEDEAVIAAVLRAYDEMELVDVSAKLPGLRYRPGLSSWIADVDIFTVGESTEKERAQSKARLPAITRDMLPPTTEEAARMHLDRAMRIFPHDQNTGGFFIALLRKTSSTSASSADDSVAAATQSTTAADDNRRIEPVLQQPIVKLSSSARVLKPQSNERSLQIVRSASANKTEKNRAIHVMQELGYNPKDVATNSNSRGEELIVLSESASPNDQQRCHSLLTQLPIRIMNESVLSQDGLVIVEDTRRRSLSLSTTFLMNVLRSWGKQFPIVQCGLPLVTSAPPSASQSGSVIDSYSILPAALCFSDQRIVRIPINAYQSLVQSAAALLQRVVNTDDDIDVIKSKRLPLVVSISRGNDDDMSSAAVDLSCQSGSLMMKSGEVISLSADLANSVLAAVEAAIASGQIAISSSIIVVPEYSEQSLSLNEGALAVEAQQNDGEAEAVGAVAGRKRRLSKAEQRRKNKLMKSTSSSGDSKVCSTSTSSSSSSAVDGEVVEHSLVQKRAPPKEEEVRRNFSLSFSVLEAPSTTSSSSTVSKRAGNRATRLQLQSPKPQVESQAELLYHYERYYVKN